MSGDDETLVRMPKLADTLVEGTLGQWLKQVGDAVARAEPLATIETDKVTTELTSPAAGTLLELLVPEGQTVAIDTPIARIGSQARSAGTPLPTAAPSATSLLLSVPASVAPPSAESASPTPPSAESASPTAPSTVDPQAAAASAALPSGAPPSSGFASAAARSVVRMTPVAARVLAEHGLSASGVPAPSGRLTKHDVLSYLGGLHESLPLAPSATQEAKGSRGVGESVAPPPRGEWISLNPMRRAIADHMTKARQSIPLGHAVMAADLTNLVAFRDAHKITFEQADGARLTFTVFFAFALARALSARTEGPVDLGVAVALDHGLVVPVLHAASTLGLGETARALADLTQRARASQLTPGEMHGAQMTLTNVGSFGNLTASPVVPLGQLAILGPGLVERRPFPVRGGGIRPGWRCLLSLMFDRRQLDDFAADRFLGRVIVELDRIPNIPNIPNDASLPASRGSA